MARSSLLHTNHLAAFVFLASFVGVRTASAGPLESVIGRYCVSCHDSISQEGDLNLESILTEEIAANSAAWEKVVRKIEVRQMPPVGEDRPSEAEYEAIANLLTASLDARAADQPYVGHVESFRRLNRTEYQNAIRDLLAVEINAAELLPADESSHGFDHITVSDLTPSLLTRYVQAAEQIASLAVGTSVNRPRGTTFRIKPDVTQEQHVAGLPLGTRGGGVFRHTFPQTGKYDVQIRLTRDRNDEVEGLHGTHHMEILLDNRRLAELKVQRPDGVKVADFDDSQLRARVGVSAGVHDLGVTFVRAGASLEETKRQPLNVHFNLHRHPRLSPAIYEVSVIGPYIDEAQAPQPAGTESRRLIFIAHPDNVQEDGGKTDAHTAARKVLTRLARRAYRRPVGEEDIERLLEFFERGYERDGFEAGIELAISAILTSPHFLLKIEREPKDAKPGEAYEISQFELASRLSFFLWSSIPDEELLNLAQRGELRQPEVLESQVKRMLADEKSANLATNFASQWLHLRNLDAITPDTRLYPDFDENLRQAMRQETQMHFQAMVAEDTSPLDLLSVDHTYLNERLAKHYGIPHVYGSRFRRVELSPADSHRGGLLRQGSVLTVTSYATRTSPVVRGNWILKNILAAPAPPPPNDVPSLDEQKMISERLTIRERLSQHREDAACARCHNLMDPVGFALENFDAVGKWRELEAGHPVDASGSLPDGNEFTGVDELESAILKKPELFIGAMTEKLTTFAVGRGLELHDAPAIRKIVRESKQQDHRFSAIVLGIVRSTPFQMRTTR